MARRRADPAPMWAIMTATMVISTAVAARKSGIMVLIRDAGVLAVHAAAFDCVPAELGCALAERALLAAGRRSTGDAGEEEEEDVLRCAGIEVIHTVRNVTSANATTFHAAVDGFHAAACGELASSRNRVREMYPEFDETSPPPRPHSWPKVPETPGAILPVNPARLLQ